MKQTYSAPIAITQSLESEQELLIGSYVYTDDPQKAENALSRHRRGHDVWEEEEQQEEQW